MSPVRSTSASVWTLTAGRIADRKHSSCYFPTPVLVCKATGPNAVGIFVVAGKAFAQDILLNENPQHQRTEDQRQNEQAGDRPPRADRTRRHRLGAAYGQIAARPDAAEERHRILR